MIVRALVENWNEPDTAMKDAFWVALDVWEKIKTLEGADD